MRRALTLVAVASLALVFTLDCCRPERVGERVERAQERAIKRATGEDVDIEVGAETEVPENLPEELLYPGADVKSSVSGTTRESSSGMVTLETNSSPARVRSYYQGLTAKGWEVEATMTTSGEDGKVHTVSLSKGEFGAGITITGEKKTTIGILYGKGMNK